MERRQFIKYIISCGASLFCGDFIASYSPASNDPFRHTNSVLKGIKIIDAHAHPEQFHSKIPRRVDRSSSLKSIRAIGMNASSFDAVGDMVRLSRGRISGTEYKNTMGQLGWVKSLEEKGEIKIVFKASDIPENVEKDMPFGAIMGIEGGDCLQGNLDKLDRFYQVGVRKLTLVHYTINALGDIMTSPPKHKKLTAFGRKTVEHMEKIGMVIDVTHAHPLMLKDLVEVCNKPVIASHAVPSPFKNPSRQKNRMFRRMRSWDGMEMVAKTGGVVCTTPVAYRTNHHKRTTFQDWASEILEMKERLGIEHVGLGTDGGGGLPDLIKGYRDVRDLTKLAAAMKEVGLSHDDIAAYMGGNFLSVLQQCIG
jgi:membrane dipeptidase